MLDKLLSPFIGYWYWAQDRTSPAAKAVALGAPLVVFGLVLYMLFGRGGDGSSALTPGTGTQGNVDIGSPTQPAATPVATLPASTGGTAPVGQTGAGATPTTAPATTPAAAPTAFTQERYTVVSGDSPTVIAEKLGVPADIRSDWIEEMLALNGVTATTLQLGQELILPPY